ncbi:hypothetical protein TNCV_4966871 [Trichonephila clavipes]|nr:hypothetical protein TNCV_4966871 [Trichonephila clavipes]
MPSVWHSQIEAHKIHHGNELDVSLSLALVLSTIQVYGETPKSLSAKDLIYVKQVVETRKSRIEEKRIFNVRIECSPERRTGISASSQIFMRLKSASTMKVADWLNSVDFPITSVAIFSGSTSHLSKSEYSFQSIY